MCIDVTLAIIALKSLLEKSSSAATPNAARPTVSERTCQNRQVRQAAYQSIPYQINLRRQSGSARSDGGGGAERLEHAQTVGGRAALQDQGELAAGQGALQELALRVIHAQQAQDLGVLGRLDGLHDGGRAGPRGHLGRALDDDLLERIVGQAAAEGAGDLQEVRMEVLEEVEVR